MHWILYQVCIYKRRTRGTEIERGRRAARGDVGIHKCTGYYIRYAFIGEGQEGQR